LETILSHSPHFPSSINISLIIILMLSPIKSQDTSVVIALRYWLDGRGFESLQGMENFLFTTAFRPALRHTQPPIQWLPGSLSLAVKRLGREAARSCPSSAEVNNAWYYNTTPQYAFME
jgi:hypothetical protein